MKVNREKEKMVQKEQSSWVFYPLENRMQELVLAYSLNLSCLCFKRYKKHFIPDQSSFERKSSSVDSSSDEETYLDH